MKAGRFAAAVMVGMVALTSAFRAQQARDPKADAALQAAIKLETIDGNLKGAIDAYAKILSNYSNNRPVAAQALAHTAGCYEKLGTTQLDEARKAYERLVRDFGDQKDLVATATARLAALGASSGTSGLALTTVWSPSPLSSSQFGDGLVSVSDDGRFLSTLEFNEAQDTSELKVYDAAKNNVRTLPARYCSASSMSRDAAQVLCAWWIGYGLYELRVMQLVDGSTRTLWRGALYEFPVPAGWSPDGTRVLARINRFEGPTDLVLISVKDGSVKSLKSDRGLRAHGVPRVSPDGRFIVFASDRIGPDGKPLPQVAGRSTLHILPVEGGQEVALVPGSPSELDWDPHWTPDNKRIVFSSNRSGKEELWSVAVVDGRPQADPEHLDAGIDPKSSNLIGFARDGTLYVQKKFTGGAVDVYLAEVDPSSARVVSPPKRVNQTNVGATTWPLAWSPDGQWLAFNRLLDSRRTLVLHSVTTGEERELPEANPWVIGWFPDGQSLLTGQGEMRTDVKTGRTQAIPGFEGVGLAGVDFVGGGLPGPDNPPALSPDGKTIYYSKADSKGDPRAGIDLKGHVTLVRREIEGGPERVIYQSTSPIHLKTIAVSPDSREVAFVEASLSPTSGSVMVMSVEGGQPREVFKGWAWGIGWSGDGKYLLFRGGDNMELWSAQVSGGTAKSTRLETDVMAVNPDGRRVAFALRRFDSLPIFAIKNLVVGPKSAR